MSLLTCIMKEPKINHVIIHRSKGEQKGGQS